MDTAETWQTVKVKKFFEKKASLMSRDQILSSFLFDNEVRVLLDAQLQRCLSVWDALPRWKAEVDAALSAALFLLGQGRDAEGRSPGQEMLGLKYSGKVSRQRRLVLGVLTVLLPYVWSKWGAQLRWGKWCDATVRGLSVLNTVLFFWQGRFSTLAERVLGLKMESVRKGRGRAVAFEYMNRQLVWEGFTEFLLFVAPLINFEKLQNAFRRRIGGASAIGLPETQCAICMQDPIVNPYGSSICMHALCYFCIASKIEEDPDYPCPRCGSVVSKQNLIPLLAPTRLREN